MTLSKFRVPLPAFIAGSVVYMELILRIFTSRDFWSVGLLLVPLFACTVGLAVYALATRFGEKGARITAAITLCLLAVLFSTQEIYYSVFNSFLIAYSLTAGGTDQVIQAGILENTINAILRGIPAILLFMLPVILVLCPLYRRYVAHKKKPLKITFAWLGAGVACHILALLIILLMPSVSSIQSGMFDPNRSVNCFGLLRTEVLDVKYNLLGIEQEVEIEAEKPIDPVKPETPPVEEAKPPQPNVMDIDFEALKDETDETYRLMNDYFSSRQPSYKNEYTGMYEGYNLITVVAEGFSPYAIDKDLTPTLYKMRAEGFNFENFYTPIWGVSTSDGEYTTCTGLIPKSGVWSFYRSSNNYMPFCLGNAFRANGIKNTYAYHNNTYTYYHRDLSHPNMGYTYKGMGNGVEKYVKNVWPQSDLEMISGSVKDYINSSEPFHAYYMTVSGHLRYTRIGNSMSNKNWDRVKDLDCSDTLKAYYACNIELDLAMEKLLSELNAAGKADKTVIMITPDHYPYGLEQDTDTYAIWRELLGRDVETEFELYKSCLLLYCQGTKNPPTVEKYCYSVDILPTLLNLFGLEYDSRLLIGNDILSTEQGLVIFSNGSFITDRGKYNATNGQFTAFQGQEFASDEEKKEYVKNLRAIVNNKFKMSTKILEKDYYGYLFGKK